MNRRLTWRHLKALHQLYLHGKTDSKILDNDYISNVLIGQKKLLRLKSGNNKVIESSAKYSVFYKENFYEDFERYAGLLQKYELEDDGKRRYTEQDIQTLLFIAEYREELSKNLSTIRPFSSQIFKGQGSKYLENKPGLKNAVCKILGITDFPDKDPKNLQWRCVVDCVSPKAIILCENIAYLKSSWKARERNIELWYVGGNNINIIDFISEEKLSKPIYYSCDWDFHGLGIYSRIKGKLKLKLTELTLLKPYSVDMALPVHSPNHYSEWDFNKVLSGLNENDFLLEEKKMIGMLIQTNQWLEEESIEFSRVLDFNNL